MCCRRCTSYMLGYCATGQNWRKLAPVTILAVLNEYMEKAEQQVVVLFQVLAAELNFGYRFQCVRALA